MMQIQQPHKGHIRVSIMEIFQQMVKLKGLELITFSFVSSFFSCVFIHVSHV